MVLFERRGDKVGYRIGGALDSTITLQPPTLTASVASLEEELRAALVRQGLYADEARAMVATWHDSWFEEGSRLIYILPTAQVNAILPVKVAPAPEHMVRVFVGRMELITPATRQAIETALKTRDDPALTKYGRFLPAILGDITLHAEKRDVDAWYALYNSYLLRESSRSSTLAQVR